MTPLNFAQWLFKTNSNNLNKIALVDDSNTILTYGELEQKTKNFAQTLRCSRLIPQQRIIICLDDCLEWPVAFLAAISVGLNPVMVSADLPLAAINKIIALSDAAAIISDNVSNLNLKQFTKNQIMVAEDTTQTSEFYEYHPDEPCFWLLTSGTSGDSKCVVHRHASLYNIFKLVAIPAFNIDINSHILSTAKLSFTYGLNNDITIGLGSGATVYLIKGAPAPTKIFNKLNQYPITHLFTVPTVLNSMLKHKQDKKMSSTVKMIVSAGEALPPLLSSKFEKYYNTRVYNHIGMSEVTQAYCAQTPFNYEHGTLGVPLPGVLCELRNEDGSLTVDGEIGELWVNSPCSALGYWKDAEKTKNTFYGPWVKTGDKVKKTKSGQYVYISRADDLIKVNGLYVAPIEIESVINTINGIVDCSVVSIKSSAGLAEIHAFIVGSISDSELRAQLNKLLPNYKIPKYFKFVESLPKTVTNKKIRSVLRQVGQDYAY
jgi:benzoate-CoA ligase